LSVRVEPDNILFRQAKQARRIPNIFLATVMHLVFISVGLGTTLMILFIFFGDWDMAQLTLQKSGGIIAAFGGMVAALWVWLRYFEKRERLCSL
jgi:polyferredoxin